MQSRSPESWPALYDALRQAGLEPQVIDELKQWLDKDPARPVQVEITIHQASLLGLDATESIH